MEHHVAQPLQRVDTGFVHLVTALCQQCPVLRFVDGRELWRSEVTGGTPHQLGLRAPQKRFEGGVTAKVLQVGVLVEHRVGNGLQQCAVEIHLFTQLCFGLLSRRDVLECHHRPDEDTVLPQRCAVVEHRERSAVCAPENLRVHALGFSVGESVADGAVLGGVGLAIGMAVVGKAVVVLV